MRYSCFNTTGAALFIGILAFYGCRSSNSVFSDNSILQTGSESTSYPLNEGRRINMGDVKEASANVWKRWCETVSSENGLKLGEIKPLAEADSLSWSLPENLEPHAVMPYRYGYKTDGSVDGIPGNMPFFLYLHGSGPKQREWENGLKLALAFDDAPSGYLIPQIPNEGEYYRWWQKAKQYAWGEVLKQVFASGLYDPDRIYIFGISEGGYGSQRLASFYADYLAGAGPMAGGEPLVNAPVENLQNTAFILRTGDKDFGFYRDKLTGYTKRALDSISSSDPSSWNYKVELIPGMGHAIDYKPTTPWLKEHVRNPYPKHVKWENFEMDGIKRTSFYNLVINKEPAAADSLRIYYTMDIEGNRVDITANAVKYETIETDPKWGIALDFRREYFPVDNGELTVFLNEHLVDLSKPVEIYVNGRKEFDGKLKLYYNNLVRSCLEFHDPRRLYPAAVTVRL